jgi:hypothetical protein
VAERNGGNKAPALDTDVIPVRPTYKQNWLAYNEAQMMEKKRLQVLLRDLCLGIAEPERPADKVGRKPVPLADQVFACAFKVYSTFSSRRFNCDLQDAYKNGYLSRPIHPNKVNTFLEGPELSPVLHRLIVQSSLPLNAVETVFAPDSTGFSTSRFVRWFDEKYSVHRSGHDWVKAHAICGVKTNIVTAVEIAGRDAGDSPMFKPLVGAARLTCRSKSTAWPGKPGRFGNACSFTTASAGKSSSSTTTPGATQRVPSQWSRQSSEITCAAGPTPR